MVSGIEEHRKERREPTKHCYRQVQLTLILHTLDLLVGLNNLPAVLERPQKPQHLPHCAHLVADAQPLAASQDTGDGVFGVLAVGDVQAEVLQKSEELR